MKRLVTLLLALVLTFSLLSCGSAESHEPVTLRLMAMSTGDGNPEFDALIAAFEELYPWVTVEAEYLGMGDTYGNALTTRLKGTDAPDLFYVAAGRTVTYSCIPYSEAGYIMDLSGFDWANSVVPEAYHNNWWNGDQLCAIPLQLAPIIVEYNVDRFEELGLKVPSTMEEFMECGKQSVAQGQPFIVLSGAHAGHSAHFIISIAMSTVYADDPEWDAKRNAGEVTFTGTEGWHRAFEIFMEMYKNGLFVPGSEGMGTDDGHAAIAFGDGLVRVIPAGNIHIIENLNPEINLGSFCMPGETEERTHISGMVIDGIAGWSQTAHPDEVKLFLDFMVNGGANAYTEITGVISMADVVSGTIKNEKLAPISYLFNEGRVCDHPSTTWASSAAYTTFGKGVQALMTGLTTIDQLLADMDAAWQ